MDFSTQTRNVNEHGIETRRNIIPGGQKTSARGTAFNHDTERVCLLACLRAAGATFRGA